VKKNILIISPSFANKGGVARVARNYMKHCRSSEIDFISIASQSHGSKFRKAAFFISAVFATLRRLIFNRVDIVHVHGGNIVSLKRKLVFLKLATFFRTKTIYHHHGGNLLPEINQLSPSWKSIIRGQLLKVNLIICLSYTLKRQLDDAMPGVTCKVIPNGVNIPDIHRDYSIKREKTLNLAFMGLIHRNKGIFDLIETTKRLTDNGYDVRLLVCGSGDVGSLQKFVRGKNMEDTVSYCGYLSGKQKDSFFRKADIFALPSYSEAMPVVILEAMAYALPVVSTRVGAIPELIDNNVNGYLVEPGNMDSLFTSLVNLVCDPVKRERFGTKGKMIVELNFNLRRSSVKLADIYTSL
jgi:glycosyltransferase involved in cell wall biosynthesis